MDQNMSTDMTAAPAVSVLMPVYNGERYLATAIESILNQTFADFEFIIVDDGSTDGTAAILADYQQRDERIQVYRQENQGIVASLNRGLELAQGKYIARMDSDDVSLPERLAKQVDFLEAHPDIGVLGTWVKIMDSSGSTSDTWQFPAQHGVLGWCLCFTCPIMHPTVMMRRQIVEQAGGYSSDMVHAEDYDLWRRLSGVTRLSNLPDVLLQLRLHEANVSRVYTSEQRRNSVRISSLMISHILNEEVPVSTVQRLWDQESQTAYDVRPVAALVYRLYKAIVSGGGLSTGEEEAIRRDAAIRLYDLSRPWVRNVSVWGVLARAFCLDPALVLRVLKGGLHRLSSMRSRLSYWSLW
jgi:glycosyltransferase involved in cell wall biosynthesis